MKMERLIGILSILLQREKATAPELAEQFEVSRRTIQRDIESLCRAGIPISTTQGAGGGISIMEGYRVDRTVLTDPEMQAILAGLRSLDSVSGTRRYAQLMEKLSVGTGGLVPGGAHMLIDLSSWYKTSLPPKIERIQGAIEQHRTIRFTYFSPKGESVRTVEPYYLVFHWSTWYVWGWCRMREDFRLFKLNRMTELTDGESFAPRCAPLPDLTPERIFPVNYQVSVLFDPTCRWRLVEEYGADRFTVEPDGKLRFTGGFPDADSVLSWVLTFGDKAELLEPQELREQLRELTETLAHRYRKGGISMASHKDFVDYVAEQLRGAGAIRSRKMFGEYGLYCDGVFFAVICDDQFFVKVTPAGEAAFPNLPKAPPYEGARDYIWVEDVDDRDTMTSLTRLTCLALQEQPKKTEEMTMAFDYKKAYREFYLPPKTPGIVTVPAMNFLAVRGRGDPNEEDGAYKQALGMLYAVAFTIKMSKLGRHKLEGYFDYVVPPLEGLWWQEGVCGVDYAHKQEFQWISLIRLPEFATREVFEWAVREAAEKKQQDFSPVEFFSWEEGLCVQCMHMGPYDDEPATVADMEAYAKAQGYEEDFGEGRFHHEIYLSDVRRCQPERLKTVIRHPIRRAE